jgi:hypothetical protein
MNYFTKKAELPRTRFRRTIAQALILALIIAFLPRHAEAKFQDLSGTLPGVISGKEVAAIAIAGGAVIGVAIFLLIKRHKKPPKTNLDSAPPPAKFHDPVPAPLTKGPAPFANPLSDPITGPSSQIPCDGCIQRTKGDLR